MLEERRNRILELVDLARKKPENFRAAFLDSVCKNEPTLRADVDQLLAQGAPPSLSNTISGFSGDRVSGFPAPDRDLAEGTATLPGDTTVIRFGPQSMVGPYR